MLRFAFASFAAMAALATTTQAQPYQYDARWFTGVRDNVLTIQERQRARIDAIERRRLLDERAKAINAPDTRSRVAQAELVSAADPSVK